MAHNLSQIDWVHTSVKQIYYYGYLFNHSQGNPRGKYILLIIHAHYTIDNPQRIPINLASHPRSCVPIILFLC